MLRQRHNHTVFSPLPAWLWQSRCRSHVVHWWLLRKVHTGKRITWTAMLSSMKWKHHAYSDRLFCIFKKMIIRLFPFIIRFSKTRGKNYVLNMHPVLMVSLHFVWLVYIEGLASLVAVKYFCLPNLARDSVFLPFLLMQDCRQHLFLKERYVTTADCVKQNAKQMLLVKNVVLK